LTVEEHFFFCAGPDKNFTGEVARELHWIWADLPPELHEKWMAEREAAQPRDSQAGRKRHSVPAEAATKDEGQEPTALEN
jgi:hypothetical protein